MVHILHITHATFLPDRSHPMTNRVRLRCNSSAALAKLKPPRGNRENPRSVKRGQTGPIIHSEIHKSGSLTA